MTSYKWVIKISEVCLTIKASNSWTAVSRAIKKYLEYRHSSVMDNTVITVYKVGKWDKASVHKEQKIMEGKQ